MSEKKYLLELIFNTIHQTSSFFQIFIIFAAFFYFIIQPPNTYNVLSWFIIFLYLVVGIGSFMFSNIGLYQLYNYKKTDFSKVENLKKLKSSLLILLIFKSIYIIFYIITVIYIFYIRYQFKKNPYELVGNTFIEKFIVNKIGNLFVFSSIINVVNITILAIKYNIIVKQIKEKENKINV